MRKLSCATFLFLSLTALSFSQTPAKTLNLIRQFDRLDSKQAAQLQLESASFASGYNLQQFVEYTFSEVALKRPLQEDEACIVHVVRWAYETTKPPDFINKELETKLVVAKSNWYVYNPSRVAKEENVLASRRLYGARNPYVLIVHLNADTSLYDLSYKYRTTHRLPANIQNLVSLIDIFKTVTANKPLSVDLRDVFAVGQFFADPPSDINLVAAITSKPAPGTPAKEMNLESAEAKFDDEGLYRWDISIGVPIVSYKQFQSINTPNGPTLGDADKRNLLMLANIYLKPVDVKDASFLKAPHLVVGASMASKPLHGAFAGLGWGPTIANFYIGTMIVTSNLPNNQKKTNYKLGFGLNFPIRAISSQLGLETGAN